MPANTEVQKYYDALLSSYDIVIDTLAKTNERTMTVTKQFAADVVKGQREALELGKKLIGEPSDMMRFYGAMLETATAAQSRAMAFSQTAYQEALGAGTDTRTLFEQLAEANKGTAGAAVEMAKRYASSNPFAEAVQRSMEAVKPKAAAPAPAAKSAAAAN